MNNELTDIIRPISTSQSRRLGSRAGADCIHYIPMSDGRFYIVSDEELALLSTQFKNIDVVAELTKLEAWLTSNTKRRNISDKMMPFVQNWMRLISSLPIGGANV